VGAIAALTPLFVPLQPRHIISVGASHKGPRNVIWTGRRRWQRHIDRPPPTRLLVVCTFAPAATDTRPEIKIGRRKLAANKTG